MVLALVAVIAIARGSRANPLLLGGLGAGVGTLLLGALTWGGGPTGAVPLAIQLLVLAAATGGVFAAMILGHWYLVTPKLPEAPLVMVARRLLWIVTLQVLLFVGWVGFGAGPGAPGSSGPFAALVGPWALFVWLRLIVGLVFPLVVSWAALQTARTRSMESATGLLYIDVGAIAAGTILAAGLYFGAGLLVRCHRRGAPSRCRDPRPGAAVRDAARGGRHARAAARGPARRRPSMMRGRRRSTTSRRLRPAGRRSGSRSTAPTPTPTRRSPTVTKSRASRRSAAAGTRGPRGVAGSSRSGRIPCPMS